MTVLLDQDGPRVKAAAVAADVLLAECGVVNDQVMVAYDHPDQREADILAFALQLVVDAVYRNGGSERQVFAALAAATGSFLNSQAQGSPAHIGKQLAEASQRVVALTRAAPTYDLDAGGRA